MDDLTRLALAARDGDRPALGEFVRRSEAEVWRFVAHQVGRDEADDITQDIYVRAWQALPRFRHDASARTWLLAIARRACVDALRRRARRARLASRLATTGDRGRVPDPTAAHALEYLIATLDRDRREAFVLTQILGCSYDETAAVCAVPVGTIRSRVARARAELTERVRAAAAS